MSELRAVASNRGAKPQMRIPYQRTGIRVGVCQPIFFLQSPKNLLGRPEGVLRPGFETPG
jgi:hypothetical protein